MKTANYSKEFIEKVKHLRQETGEGLFFCSRALEEANGDFDVALKALTKNLSQSDMFAVSLSGLVASHIHMDKIGAMVKVGTDTDFCARTDVVKDFAKKLCVHICAKTTTNEIAELLAESWVYDESKTVEQMLNEVCTKTGENVCVKIFVRFSL